jgi:hypothetical protein
VARSEAIRKHPRFRGAAWIECPILSISPFPAEDMSAGGFRAVLTHKPLEGHPYQVTVRVGESAFGPYPALVAWSQPQAQRPGVWSFGMLIAVGDEPRERLAAALERTAKAA